MVARLGLASGVVDGRAMRHVTTYPLSLLGRPAAFMSPLNHTTTTTAHLPQRPERPLTTVYRGRVLAPLGPSFRMLSTTAPDIQPPTRHLTCSVSLLALGASLP